MDRVHAVREQELTEEKLMFPEADESLAWTLPPDDRATSEQEDEDIDEEEEPDQGREDEEAHLSAPIEFDRSVQQIREEWPLRQIREEWSLRVLA